MSTEDRTMQNIMRSLPPAQINMLLSIAHGGEALTRNPAVRGGLAERGLIDIIAPPSNWQMRLTQLGQSVAAALIPFVAERMMKESPESQAPIKTLLALFHNDAAPSEPPKWWSIVVYGLVTPAAPHAITPQGRAVAAALESTFNLAPAASAPSATDPKAIAQTLTADQKELLTVAMVSKKGLTHPDKCHPDSVSRAVIPVLEKLGLVQLAPDNMYVITPLGGQVYGELDANGEGELAEAADEAPTSVEALARTLNAQERLILDELSRRRTMTLTEGQALHSANLKKLGVVACEGSTITMTSLGLAVADAVNTLEILGEYQDDPATPDTPDAPTDHIAEPVEMVESVESEPNEPPAVDDRAALLAEIETLRNALLDAAAASNKDARSEIPRGNQKALQLNKKQMEAIKNQSDAANRRAAAAERELAALIKSQSTSTTDAPAATDPTEITKLKASMEEMQIQLKRLSFNHKRQLDEKDATAAKLRAELEAITRDRDELKREATRNAREFVSQANQAQELRERVEQLEATLERIKPASGGGTQYRIARNTNEAELAKMHAAGWGFQHMQFMPDGALHVVFVHAPAPQQLPAQPPLHAVVTDTQDAEIVSEDEPANADLITITITEPPTSPTPAHVNGFNVIIDDAPGIPTPDATDPDGVEAMRQMMRSGVPADQITATLNQRNLEQARAGFTTRQQQAANFAASNPPANRPAPPPRRFIPSN